MKKTPNSIKIIKESNSVYLVYKKNKIQTSAGTSDTVMSFITPDNNILVLITNYRLDYIGATIYDKETLKKKKDIFSQDIDDLNRGLRTLGMRKKDILEYTPNAQADWLYQLMIY